MKTTKLPIAILLLLASAATLDARMVVPWSYSQLRESADIVVIAKAVSNTDINDVYLGKRDGYIGVNTEFEMLDVIKGDVQTKTITVLHFKNDPRTSHMDGMLAIHFRIKTLATTDAEIHGKTTPGGGTGQEYMLYLKKRADGRYEPVTGQMDARFSAKEIADPPLDAGGAKELKPGVQRSGTPG